MYSTGTFCWYKLLPFSTRQYFQDNFRHQEDNTLHCGRLVIAFVQQQGFTIVENTAKSVDYIHIEHFWNELNYFTIPQCTCSISHNAPFRTEMCTFLFWIEHCGTRNSCIVWVFRLVYLGMQSIGRITMCRIWVSCDRLCWMNGLRSLQHACNA